MPADSIDMEAEAQRAALVLAKLPNAALDTVSTWWKEWFLLVGHRRLGRMIVSYPSLGDELVSTGNVPPRPKAGKIVRLTPAEMEAYAPGAAADLAALSAREVQPVADWWKSWYGKAGHKRLGRLIVDISRNKFPNRQQEDSFSPPVPEKKPKPKVRLTKREEVGIEPVAVKQPPPPGNATPSEGSGSGLLFQFSSDHLDSPAPFTIKVCGGRLSIVLNRAHVIYPQLSGLLGDVVPGSDLAVTGAMLRAWAKYEFELPPGAPRIRARDARAEWGRSLRSLLLADREDAQT